VRAAAAWLNRKHPLPYKSWRRQAAAWLRAVE